MNRTDLPLPHARSTRFPAPAEKALRAAGWQPGRWDIKQAEVWADTLRAHTSPGGHVHSVFPAAVEAWAEFGGLAVPAATRDRSRQIAPTPVLIDPLRGLHMARTLADLGRALETEVCALGEEIGAASLLAMDTDGRVYAIDHTGDWYIGADIDLALSALLTGARPVRLTAAA